MDFSQILTTFDGKPLRGETGDELALRDVCITALMNDIPGPGGQPEMRSGEQKWRAGQLAARLEGEVSLTVEEVTLLKERVGKMWSASVVLAAWPLLDPGLKP